mmetsp:Transcript_7717/g.20278  ORF Transcript_7717/g.20278 Transcript_7717/m.20278 type:complete len:149 (-) Transcript_7717:751-1197(-)
MTFNIVFAPSVVMVSAPIEAAQTPESTHTPTHPPREHAIMHTASGGPFLWRSLSNVHPCTLLQQRCVEHVDSIHGRDAVPATKNNNIRADHSCSMTIDTSRRLARNRHHSPGPTTIEVQSGQFSNILTFSGPATKQNKTIFNNCSCSK